MPKNHSINVRALAEFTLQTGDLVPAAEMIDRMNDGSLGHRQLQAMLGDEWTAEEYVSRVETVEGVEMRVQGRADAVSRKDGALRVLEIKTTAQQPSLIRIDDYPAHLAQGQIYAYLLCANEGADGAEVTLCYYRLDGAQNSYRRRYSIDELRAVFLR